MALSWSHAVLMVKDEDTMRDFYTRVLKFQITDRGPIPENSEIIFMSQEPAEHHQLAMILGRTDEGPSNTLAHLAFRVADLPELRSIIDRLQDEGVTLRPTTHGNTWSVYFQDPEQNGIEIFCDTPWQVRQPIVDSWDMTLDDNALTAWTHETFQDAAGFSTQADFVARRERELAEAGGSA